MESDLLGTLLNILLLSSLACVWGSVVRQADYRYPYTSEWKDAQAHCRNIWRAGDWTLPSQQKHIDRMNIFNTHYYSKWIGQTVEQDWNDDDDDDDRRKRTKCAYIKATPEKNIHFGHCETKNYFYCYDDKPQSPITFIPGMMSWTHARAYCKDKHTDLVTPESGIQLEDLPDVDLFYLWTDMRRTEAGGNWTLSADDAVYQNWEDGEPTGGGNCVGISNTERKMTTIACSSYCTFNCLQNNLVLVKQSKSWEEAVDHCRAMDHHSDLISISGSDQETVWAEISDATTDEVWTGLRYLAHRWFWTDGTAVPYQDLPDCPDLGEYCGTLVRDNNTILWNIRNCTEKRNFLCYRKY